MICDHGTDPRAAWGSIHFMAHRNDIKAQTSLQHKAVSLNYNMPKLVE
jgi:hypothetical protein